MVLGRPLTEAMLDELRAMLAGRISVLVGHSGVGKSTLVNALIPDAGRAVGTVSAVTGRGRHTSSSAVALRLPGGGWLIDTPGLRSFGLGHIVAGPDRARPSPIWPRERQTARRAAPTWSRTARWTPGSPPQGGVPLAARLDSLRRLLRSLEGLGSGDSAAEDGAPDDDAGDSAAARGPAPEGR